MRYISIMIRKNGFSLIELMVVIAIVAVLAAIALPQYKLYILRGKLQAPVDMVNSLAEQSLLFHDTHGSFATAYDLGLSNTPNAGNADDSAIANVFGAALISNGNNFEAYDFSNGTCQTGGVTVSLNSSYFNLDSSIQDVVLQCDVFNIGGVMKKLCGYSFDTIDTNDPYYTMTGVITGWYNYATPESDAAYTAYATAAGC